MKTTEQIKIAEHLAKKINDYVVLTKAEKKLKTMDIEHEINKITIEIKDKVKEL